MTLSELVPSLDLCQQLKAAGFSQDTAFGWHKHIRVWGDGQFDDEWDWFLAEVCPRNADDFLCAAPTAGELMVAIRVKADAMEEKADRGMELERHEWDGKIVWEVVGRGKGMCEDDWLAAEGEGITDLQALAALVLEVAG